MAQHNNGSKLGWTLLGWMNLVAVALLILVFTGARPTLGQILGGTALFLFVTILVVWAALRRR
ncbi:MAG: hypothetical protein DCC55_06800 [Chloroflexi bacterium]|nr:MAG: hypothetical protein DCC55_06800 [Chloroflexota bacterium]